MKNNTDIRKSWNNKANVLFIDNPAGVGFSYGKRNVDLLHNDISFRKDALAFILNFYSYWPKLVTNPLYIFGHSYGGTFAPTLAWAIHICNQELALNASLTGQHINLKGFISANGATDFLVDPYISGLELANEFNLIPNDLFKEY